ncbi:MAG: endospore germination permease [Clostridiaceae bacterium]
MRIEKGTISSKQLTFMVVGLIQGSVLNLAFVYGITKQDTWIVILTGLFLTLLMVYIFTAIMNRFPKKSIIEINNKIFGNVLGKIISLVYIYHFFLIIPRTLKVIGDFAIQNLLVDTPSLVIIVSFTLVCAYAVKNGLEVIARCAIVLVICSFFIAFTLTFFLLKEFDLRNFMPFFQINLKDFIQGTHIIFAIPFSEVMIFFMIAPYTNNTGEIKRSIFIGTIIGGIYVFVVALRNIAASGIITYISSFSAYQESTLIEIGRTMAKFEVLVAIVFFLTMFTKICFFYYGSLLSIAHFFHLREYKFLVFPCGIIMICFSFIMYSNPIEHLDVGSNLYPIYSFPIEVIIPILTLIIAKIRKLPKKIA